MSRKTKLIIALILSILGLCYLLCEQFGIIRQYKMRFSSPESFISQYTSLPKADEKNRVIIVFSTENINSVIPFINSILTQTVKIDEIVWIKPYKNKSELPNELKKIISVRNYSKNYDSKIAPLICSVLQEPESDTKIIVIKNKKIYDIDFIETMLEKSVEKDDIIQDKDFILIKPKFFDDSICNNENVFNNII